MVRRCFIFCVLATALALPLSARASLRSAPSPELAPSVQENDNVLVAQRDRRKRKRRDHDRARDAVGAGDVMPLREIMARIGRHYPGRLLDADLGRDGQGRWIYRLKLLSPGDQVRRLSVDAQSGRVMEGGRR